MRYIFNSHFFKIIIYAFIVIVFYLTESSSLIKLFGFLVVSSFYFPNIFESINFKEESKLSNKKIQNSFIDKEKEVYEEVLSEKPYWWVKYDLRSKKIVDKNFCSRKFKLSEIFFLHDDKENIDQLSEEEFILEKLLLKIIPHEKEEMLSENWLHSENFQLNYQIENFESSFKSDEKKENFKKVGWISRENDSSYNLLEVFFKKTSSHQTLFEFVFMHSEIPKNIISQTNFDVKKKSIQLSKIAHEIKNIILVINNTCKHNGSNINKISKFDLSSLDHEEEKRNENFSKYSLKNSIQLKESFNYIQSLSNYLLFLIEDLNSFAKLENYLSTPFRKPQEEIELIPVLNFCLNIFKNRKKYDANKSNLEIYSEYECKRDIKVFTNEIRLKQILINLLSNAYKFTISGKIILGVKNIENEKIRISVSDTGCGFSEDEKKKLFNLFTVVDSNQHLNSHGSGLGLLIIKEFLVQMGSKLELDSTKYEGSTFWFDLDYCTSSATHTSYSQPSIASELDTGEKNTVIYEKNLILNQSLKKVLVPFYTNLSDVSSFLENYLTNKDKEQSNLNDLSFNQLGSINQSKSLKYSSLENYNKKISRFRNYEKRFESESENKKSVEKVIIDCYSDSDFEDNRIILDTKKPSQKFLHCEFDNDYFSNPREILRRNSINSSDRNSHEKFHADRSKIKFKKVQKIKSLYNKLDTNYDEPKNSHPKKLNVVICDDEKTILLSTANIMNKFAKNKNLNLNIITCFNGIECIYRVYEEYKKRQYIDMIFVDENMPFIKGSLLCKIIKTMSKEKQINDIKVFIVTSFEDEEYIQMIKSNDCDEILNKPISTFSLENVFK